jgi:23S rRNA pseudouridine2605 synthase
LAHGKSPRHERKHERKRPRRAGDRGGSSKAAAPVKVVDQMPAGGPVRVQRILAAAGWASRRGSEEFIEQGRVTINGILATLGDRADPTRDIVALDGERLVREKLAYFAAHKPRGMLTTRTDPHGRRTILDLLPAGGPRVFPVGRLDLDTSGLVLLTNDGALAHRLLHPSLGSEREYRVVVKGELSDTLRARLERGIHLEDGKTAPARVKVVRFDPEKETTHFDLILTEGRKRQIRRSLLALKRPVKRLERTRFGPLRLGRLSPGEVRGLRREEIEMLWEHAHNLESNSRPAGSA